MTDSSDTPVSLESLMVPSRTVSFDYPGYSGLTFELCHLAREELIKLRKKCVTSKYNKKTHQPEDSFDEELFLELYCGAVVKGWAGFKYRYLEEFLLVDTSKFEPDDTLPFTPDNAKNLMKNADGFDTWVMEMVGDLENFTGNK